MVEVQHLARPSPSATGGGLAGLDQDAPADKLVHDAGHGAADQPRGRPQLGARARRLGVERVHHEGEIGAAHLSGIRRTVHGTILLHGGKRHNRILPGADIKEGSVKAGSQTAQGSAE